MQIKSVLASSLAATLLAIPNVHATMFSQRPEVQSFIQEAAQEHKIDAKAAIAALSKISSSDEVIQRITTPAEALPWGKYQTLFISEQRITEGVSFWKKYATTLQQAESKYGVPAQLIVAIIGVESFYGKNRGKYPVLQALATLAFDYPPRAKFFKSELIQYLLLTAEHRLDPLELKGSYAGAMGSPQFISSSYRHYAVDFDESGQIDLINNMKQAIGSVANYFKVHGWQPGQPVAYKANAKGANLQGLTVAAKNNPKPVLSLDTLKQHGLSTKEANLNPEAKVALLEFENGDNKEYWFGLNNFYVITRYNLSSNYAMAVYQLSQAIANSYQQQTKSKTNG